MSDLSNLLLHSDWQITGLISITFGDVMRLSLTPAIVALNALSVKSKKGVAMENRMFTIVLAIAAIATFRPAHAQDVCNILNGSVIVAQDSSNTLLGKIASSFDSNSIFNEFGSYGNEFSSDSIWNEFSTFGNEFNADSPFNKFSSSPPLIIKGGRVIGYLSANKSIRGSISPNLLKALCEDAL